MLATWLVSLPIRNASIVDIVWGVGFVIVAWTAFLVSDGADPRRWLLTGANHALGAEAVRLPGDAQPRQGGGLPVSGDAAPSR